MVKKHGVVSSVFVQRKGKLFQRQKVKEKNFVGGNIKGDVRERIWLLWCSKGNNF